MRIRLWQWSRAVIGAGALLVPIMHAKALANPALAYETVEPARIKLGETATIRVTSLDGYLDDIQLPKVAGLTFEIVGRAQGLEFINGQASPAWYILIRVTPQALGLFSIPGLTAKSPALGLEVVAENTPSSFSWQVQKSAPPAPAPHSSASIPKGARLKADAAAFVQLSIPTRPVYVGENVPMDIEVGVRPGVVTSMNGLPALNSSDFTLTLSKQPLRRDQNIDGNPFLVMTWHSALTVVKPGNFSLSVETPLSVRVDTRSADDQAFGSILGWPFSQIPSKGVPPKNITVASSPSELKVLSLPAAGRPRDFGGAVGEFQASSEVSSTRVAAGDPLTLKLHISGIGNFDRVESSMFDHLDHWKTYPPKSSVTRTDPGGTRGEKVFEQPLIAVSSGEQSIPPLEFSYFNPTTRRYERVRTQPIQVMVSTSLADSSLRAPSEGRAPEQGSARQLARGLRPDHSAAAGSVRDLRPLYFRLPFLGIPATLTLVLAGLAVRSRRARPTVKTAERALAQMSAAAHSGNSSLFLETARAAVLQALAHRWRLPPEQIGSTELRARLGKTGAEIDRLFALADEARYAAGESQDTDYSYWLALVRGELVRGAS